MMREGFPWTHIAIIGGLLYLVCRLANIWLDASGYFLLIAVLALFIFMAKNDWIAWIPVAITGILMYLAKITNIGVTNYNWFLFILISWSTILVFFYRGLTVRRRDNGKA